MTEATGDFLEMLRAAKGGTIEDARQSVLDGLGGISIGRGAEPEEVADLIRLPRLRPRCRDPRRRVRHRWRYDQHGLISWHVGVRLRANADSPPAPKPHWTCGGLWAEPDCIQSAGMGSTADVVRGSRPSLLAGNPPPVACPRRQGQADQFHRVARSRTAAVGLSLSRWQTFRAEPQLKLRFSYSPRSSERQ